MQHLKIVITLECLFSIESVQKTKQQLWYVHSTNTKHDMMALKIDTLPICNYYVLSNSHLYLVHMYLVALFVISSHNLKLPQVKKGTKKEETNNS